MTTEAHIAVCARCARLLRHRCLGRSDSLKGRGLCSRCYRRCELDGTLVDYPRRNRSRDELLEDWVILCHQEGHSLRDIAGRLRMKPTSLERAIQRARAAGDPRALRAS